MSAIIEKLSPGSDKKTSPGNSSQPEAILKLRHSNMETSNKTSAENLKTLKENFPVTGLSCASCALTVEKTLKAEAGVVDASVNYASGIANVEYIPSLADKNHFKTAVQSAGYNLIIRKNADLNDIEKERSGSYNKLRRRTIFAMAFSIPVIVIEMILPSFTMENYIMWLLATPVVFIFGGAFFRNAWKLARRRTANMDTLVALSTGIAYAFSVFNTLYPSFWVSRGLEPHVYFEAASVVISFILIGKLIEERAKAGTSAAIKKLIGLQPNEVVVIDGNEEQQTINIAEVKVNDRIVVRAGDKVAVDGQVMSGSSFVNESMISGETIPVLKEAGSSVFAGTINQNQSFVFKATKIGSETLLAQIAKMVEDAQDSKAPVQKLVDKIAAIFAPIIIAVALVTFLCWIILGGTAGFSHGILAMVTVLVIACPCALGLATPTALMVGMGKGAQNGILIKDAVSLEKAKDINAIIFDKTGTITQGELQVKNIFWQDGQAEKQYSQVLLSVERLSSHPVAEAISKYYADLNTSTITVEDIEEIPGEGMKGKYKGLMIYAGTADFIKKNHVFISTHLQSEINEVEDAPIIVWFAVDAKAIAAVAIADKIKITSAEAIMKLENMDIAVHMLTGDNAGNASTIAKQAGIKSFRSQMKPADKLNFVKELQAKNKIVAMVGDGINDSPALAQSDVSIAMGRGSGIAMDAAQITLISSNLMNIPKAIRLSKVTDKVIRQNLFWAFIYNIIGIPIAAGILYPFTGFLLNPMIAGAAMALSSISVVGNSLRLKWTKL